MEIEGTAFTLFHTDVFVRTLSLELLFASCLSSSFFLMHHHSPSF
jgi:hypothetical protein